MEGLMGKSSINGPFFMAMLNNQRVYLVGGIPTPLKNDGVRQLGSSFPIYGNIKFMFQTTYQIIIW